MTRAGAWVLAIAAGVAAASLILLVTVGLREEYSIESFVARDDPEYLRFRHFLEIFVSNEIGVVAVTSDDALAAEPVEAVGGLAEKIRAIPDVERVSSIADLPYVNTSGGVLKSAAGLLGGPKTVGRILIEQPQRRAEIQAWLLANPLVAENLLSRDAGTAAIVVQTAGEGDAGLRREKVVRRLRELTAAFQERHPQWTVVLAGPLVTIIDLFDALHRDLLVFSITVAVMILAMLAYVFRRPGPVAASVFVAAAATLTTLGLSILLGVSMSLLTQVLVILITINAVAACVHVIVVKREIAQEQPDLSADAAARLAWARLAGPCTVVSLTTAAGFGSVFISDLRPFQDFSLLMVFGVLWSLVMVLALAARPSRGQQSGGPGTGPAHETLSAALTTLAGWSRRHKLPVASIFVLVTGVVAIKIPTLRFESDFVKNFRYDSEVRRSYRYITQRLSPVGPMEVVIRSRDGGPVLTPDALGKCALLEQQAVERFDVIKKANGLDQVFSAGGLDIPSTMVELNVRLGLLRRFGGQAVIEGFVTPDRKTMRVNLRATEAASAYEKLDVSAGVLALARGIFGPAYEVEVTGLYPFYAGLIAGLLADQARSFVLALTVIFLVLWAGFRSFVLTALAMIPNLLPMVFCLGVMGWVRIPVNMGTAMILSVALGIAVDNTVHYLWWYRRELLEHGDEFRAMVAAHRSVGRACVFTTCVLVGGFWILCLSRFLPTVYFGALVGVTMLGALGADLILWPLILTTLRPIRASGSEPRNTESGNV